MMKLFIKNIFIVTSLILLSLGTIFAQTGLNCTSPLNIDATIPNNYTTSFSFAGGEIWYEFELSPSTANRYVTLGFSNNGVQNKFDYKIYGPFQAPYNCNSLGIPIKDESSHVYNNPAVSNNCITYDETKSSPPITFEMNSSSSTNYYIVKVILFPGQFSNQQSIDISSVAPTVTTTTTQVTSCSPGYIEGTDTPCATNDLCNLPITICTDFTQIHDCNNCLHYGEHNRFYVLDIQNANTTVNVSVSSPFSSNPRVIYSLSNQMLYGPCDPSLMLPGSLLQTATGQTFIHTFPNTGLYLLNIAIQNMECPTIEIDFVDIDENCQPVIPPPTCESNLTCETVTKLCNDIHVESPCDCNGSQNYLLWYEFVITDLSQQLNISGNVYIPNPSSTNPLNFQYYIAKPPVADYECNSDLQNYIIATGTTTSLNYAFNAVNAGLGTYILVIDPQCDANLYYDFDISFTPELNCDEDPLCETCIGSFAPIPGQKYLVTAWAKEVAPPITKTTYDNPQLSLLFNDINTTVLGPFIPTGDIIDGWQRIEVEFTVPSSAQEMEILFGSVSGEVLFDDIRVLPFNSNMKSFVYDPINMRLVAELDERHYATFYEYDEEGQLIRVKKETERGIMTIQETKSNTSKPE